jgi:hypothetical protein
MEFYLMLLMNYWRQLIQNRLHLPPWFLVLLPNIKFPSQDETDKPQL